MERLSRSDRLALAPIKKLAEQCLAILAALAVVLGIVLGLPVEELPHCFEVLGLGRVYVGLRLRRRRRRRLVLIEPRLRGRETGPARQRRIERHLAPLRMERWPLQLLDLG